jgi:hypothetical protein
VGDHVGVDDTAATRPTASGGASVSLDWSEDEPGQVIQNLLIEQRHAAGHDLIVDGHGRIERQHKGPLVAHRSVLAPADVEALGIAVRDRRRCCAEIPERIFIVDGDLSEFDIDLFEPDPVTVEVSESKVAACVEVFVTRTEGAQADYIAWLAPAVQGHGCEILSVRLTDENDSEPEDVVASWPAELHAAKEEYLAAESARPRIVQVRVAPSTPMTVGTLLTAGSDVHALLAAFRSGPITVGTARNLIIGGRSHLLVGQRESEWLEVKGEAYNLQAPGNVGSAAKIELAQDVARFANSDVAALLVIGLKTQKENGHDVIRFVTPAKLSTLSADQHRNVIDARVYPTVDGLTIETVDTGGDRGLLLIGIPAQPTEYKPFLVHGAIVGDRVEGAFISIVRRRGEGSITTTASQIHTQLTTGRALLQEMSADRIRRTEKDLRRKSEAASTQVLAVVTEADDDCSRPPATPQSYFNFDNSRKQAEAIRRHEWGILDEEVRGRVQRCRAALLSFGANSVTFEGNRDAATVVLKTLVSETRLTLEAYLADRALPPWTHMFDPGSDPYDWLVRTSGPRSPW